MAASAENPQTLIEGPDHPLPNAPAVDSPTERDAREATQLARLRRDHLRAGPATATATATASRRLKAPETLLEHFAYAISKFWRHQVSVTVPHDTCRDHLALERTFLGYLRTSLALSMIGITVAQLFRLQHSPTPNAHFGFFVLGKPLGCICQSAAIYTLVIGAFRGWRLQNAIIRGKAITGGLEIMLLAVGILLILLLFCVLLIAIDITKEDVASK